jgi:hypothetical protein
MAMPTTQYPAPPVQQAPTYGVGTTGRAGPPGALESMRPSMVGVQQTPATPGAEPVLFDDIEPVLLCRLYPDAASSAEARAAAMAAGVAAHEAGLNLVAAAQEPVAGAEAPPPPPAPQYPAAGGWQPPPLQTPR